MKLLLTSILTLITAPALFADVAIYSGAVVTKTTSADGSSTVVPRMVEIVDLVTGQSQALILERHGHARTFSVEPALATTITTVADSRNKRKFAVISFAATTTDATTNVTSTASVLLRGAIGSWSIKSSPVSTDPTVRTPPAPKSEVAKQFQGVSSLVTSEGTGSASSLVISTPVLNLDSKLSKTANDAGHLTVDAALADVKAALTASGYTEKP
jgi:predicted DNA-binding ribbon-helix-helix protein